MAQRWRTHFDGGRVLTASALLFDTVSECVLVFNANGPYVSTSVWQCSGESICKFTSRVNLQHQALKLVMRQYWAILRNARCMTRHKVSIKNFSLNFNCSKKKKLNNTSREWKKKSGPCNIYFVLYKISPGKTSRRFSSEDSTIIPCRSATFPQLYLLF